MADGAAIRFALTQITEERANALAEEINEGLGLPFEAISTLIISPIKADETPFDVSDREIPAENLTLSMDDIVDDIQAAMLDIQNLADDPDDDESRDDAELRLKLAVSAILQITFTGIIESYNYAAAQAWGLSIGDVYAKWLSAAVSPPDNE